MKSGLAERLHGINQQQAIGSADHRARLINGLDHAGLTRDSLQADEGASISGPVPAGKTIPQPLQVNHSAGQCRDHFDGKTGRLRAHEGCIVLQNRHDDAFDVGTGLGGRNGQIVGFRSPRREGHILRPCADGAGNRLTRILEQGARTAACTVHR